VLERVRRTFRELGISYELVLTECPGHARALAAARAPECGVVHALGGDGTVMEVVGALAHTGTPVGIIPAGTGNLVARTLGVPLDPERAVRWLAMARAVTMDLGLLNGGRYFAFAAGVGVDARMIAETGAAAKQRFGLLAYATTATRAALQCRTVETRVTVDGETFTGQSAAVLVANMGNVLNGLITLGPDIRSDDGQLDLCLFTPRGTAEAVGVAWRMFRGGLKDGPAMMFRRGSVIRVECEPPQRFHADGELLGSTPFEARIQPGAGTFLVAGG
jgi:YegS/Rv2252/BmrU family lipid kinase